MIWTDLHADILCEAFKKVLGDTDRGAIAYVRCLSREVIDSLARNSRFAPSEWEVRRVSDFEDESLRTITADRAVELREDKGAPILLLIDTDKAGAGMDGIYSAALEIYEEMLFHEAHKLVKLYLSSQQREYAEMAIKKARGYNHRFHISLWTEFDYLVQIAAGGRYPGELLYLLGLWPVAKSENPDIPTELKDSLFFMDRLFGKSMMGWTPSQRIESLNLCDPSNDQLIALQSFLRSAATKTLLSALKELADKKNLWIHFLTIEWDSNTIHAIKLTPWRSNTGKIVKWSGLSEGGNPSDPPEFILKLDTENRGEYSKFEVRWKTEPNNLLNNSLAYKVAVVSDMHEELAVQEILHRGGIEQKCIFTNDDFSSLNENTLLNARTCVSVIDNGSIESQYSEEFIIRYGDSEASEKGKIGQRVRTFSEGLIELEDHETVTNLLSKSDGFSLDSKGTILLRTEQIDKRFRVFQPPLLLEVEKQWINNEGMIGRWKLRVQASGDWASPLEFAPFDKLDGMGEIWDRVSYASKRMSDQFQRYHGVGQVYDEKSKTFENISKEYLLSWAALLEHEKTDPLLALVNTVEIRSLAGRTIGLIVLPAHPLRVAWHVAYDNLVFHTAFEEKLKPKVLREEFSVLDGAMFPPFLPGLQGDETFVFSDTLGFHAVGMTLDSDKEPKASLAILARALGESETEDTAPTVGNKSAEIIGDEILRYMNNHRLGSSLRIHALHPGDGFTVSRAISHVVRNYMNSPDEDSQEVESPESKITFMLELHPSKERNVIAGRYISTVREKRRSGSGTTASEDKWMLESISYPGGVNLPLLCWSRKEEEPKRAAHLAIAFDTFESRVDMDSNPTFARTSPFQVYGLLSFFERDYSGTPPPQWRSFIPRSMEGEKHPSDRSHTDRLMRLYDAIQTCVVRRNHGNGDRPVLLSRISSENSESLQSIHQLCDWVITLDRNAGIEYFDSPRENKDIYDAYVIDCVPEREDLGCLQLITSTSNLNEVRYFLDVALEKMGLARSRKNAEFLMHNLKDVSGRLAIQMTGTKEPDLELLVLVLAYANCRQGSDRDDGWVSLRDGFLIPVDEINELLPPLKNKKSNETAEKLQHSLIYVSSIPRKGLVFRFIEVGFSDNLRDARDGNLVQRIETNVESLRKKWADWYINDQTTLQAIRRVGLARVLRFYADKARRHADDEHSIGISEDKYQQIVSDTDRMIEKGMNYTFASRSNSDLGWIFCPEYASASPTKIPSSEEDTRIFLFGPSILPDWHEHTSDADALQVESIPINESTSHPSSVIPSSNIASQVPSEVYEDTEGISSICLGKDIQKDEELRWNISIKGNPHLLIAGLPGMGKTTCLLNICKQMLESGIRPIIFSYHQDIDEKLQQLIPSVRFIDFHGLDFNPLKVIDRKSRMAYLDVAGAMRDIFAAIFPEIGDIQGETLRKAIKDSFVESGWDDQNADISQLLEPQFKRFVEILRADPSRDKGLRTLLARLEELNDYGFFDITETQSNLWDSSEVIVIRIHTTQNEILQKAFASLVFYGLYKDMFRRGVKERITHAVIFDEAHRASKLKLIPTMAKECRKYGISLVLASQEAKDFNDSLFSAIANYLVLRLNETDAKALVRNVTSSDQERDLVNKIKQIDKFQAFYFSESRKRPAKIQLLSDSAI